MSDNEPWFRHKEIGYGAGLPMHWKGWVLTGVYIVCLMGFPYVLEAYNGYPPDVPARVIAIAAITIPFIVIAWRKTDGGWRWRSGEDEEISSDSKTPRPGNRD